MITHNDILQSVPQKAPFRFIEAIEKLDENSIVGRYTFKEDEFFYKGHFPGKPITPGVILLETLAQTGVVAYGIYLLAQEKGLDEINNWLTLFSDANVEFSGIVVPSETVTILAEKIYWRRMKLKVDAKMINQAGDVVCQAQLSGIGVRNNES